MEFLFAIFIPLIIIIVLIAIASIEESGFH